MGQVGYLVKPDGAKVTRAEVIQVLTETSLLIDADDVALWVEDFDTKTLDDDSSIEISDRCFEIVGKKQYTNVLGASRVVFVLRPFDFVAAQEEALRRKPIGRDWTAADGTAMGNAGFIRVVGVQALLIKPTGEETTVRLAELSTEDQAWIRDVVKRRAARPDDVLPSDLRGFRRGPSRR
jgi:hypothetical protein